MAKRGLPWSRREGAVRQRPRSRGGAVAAVRGFHARRSTGYQGISATAGAVRVRPADLRRSTLSTQNATVRTAVAIAPRHLAIAQRPYATARPGGPVAYGVGREPRRSTQVVRRILLGRNATSQPARHHHARPRNKSSSNISGDRKHARRGMRPFDWRCTWPGVSRTTHSSGICRPPPSSAGTARSTGCACRVSTPMRSSPVCSAPRSTGSGGSGPAHRRTRAAGRRPPPLPGRLARPGVRVGHPARHGPRDRLHAAARRRPAAGADRRGRQRPGADALRAADALLATAGSCRGCTRWTARTVAVAGPDSVWLDTEVETYGKDLTTYSDFTVAPGERIAFTISWQPSHKEPPAAARARGRAGGDRGRSGGSGSSTARTTAPTGTRSSAR